MNSDIMKLFAEEMLEKADKKDIKCWESYLTGFSSGLKRMILYLTEEILKESIKENIELPDKFKDLQDLLKNER